MAYYEPGFNDHNPVRNNLRGHAVLDNTLNGLTERIDNVQGIYNWAQKAILMTAVLKYREFFKIPTSHEYNGVIKMWKNYLVRKTNNHIDDGDDKEFIVYLINHPEYHINDRGNMSRDEYRKYIMDNVSQWKGMTNDMTNAANAAMEDDAVTEDDTKMADDTVTTTKDKS